MKKPKWLSKPVVEAIHIRQVREHGGHYGVRDSRLLESALARPMNCWLHEPTVDIFMLAAVLGHGLTRNYSFVDGNKRVGFVAMYVFLGVNGYDLDAPEPEVVDLMLQVAEGNVSETSLAEWLRQHSVPSAP
ncbi:MAG: type II toxin-antitoxin system death-on-curing family toxin [Bacillota bacterium]|nr:type II toxin-antitoxin system death-on-curing family toxin [Bacillota bacterium]